MPSNATSKPRRYRGRPVKIKAPKRAGPGRPRIHPPDERGRDMVRRTEAEHAAWVLAARAEARTLGIPDERLTIGPWLRRLANLAAREKGFAK